MKYLIGFIIGVLFTTILFIVLQRRSATTVASPEESSIASVTPPASSTPSADFDNFYSEFHSDSAYQMAHILFPLEGIPPSADSLTFAAGNFRWQQDDWRIHKPFDSMEGEFIRDLRQLSEGLILEQIKHNSGQYGMQRRFARFDDGWYLIYYAAMNKLVVEETAEE